jgi:ribonuclease P protein component
MNTGFTFHKQERLCGSSQVDRLFQEGNRQISVFPVRLVWLRTDTPGIRVLISAPKRKFHHAVDRNHIKRQIREFYRLNSASIKALASAKGFGLDVAFLFLDNRIWNSDPLSSKLSLALERLKKELEQIS